MPRAIVYLVLLVNLFTFCTYGWDKLCARNGWRRIAEAHLLWLSFCGGLFGAWAAVSFFRHKTQKASFRRWLILVSVCNPFWLLLWYAKFA